MTVTAPQLPGNTGDPAGTAASLVAAHEADTSNVHGVPNTHSLDRLRGARVAAIGDSLTAAQGAPLAGVYGQQYGLSSLFGPTMHAQPRMDPWGAFGVSGNTSAQILARITDVTGMSTKPDYCIVLAGTNDAGAAVAVTTYLANMTAIGDALQNADIVPVFVAVPPQPSTVVSGFSRRHWASRYNAALRNLCTRRGWTLIDPNPSLINPTSGAWQAIYDSGDNIHPNALGYRVLGEAIGAGLAAVLPSWDPPFPQHGVAADNVNLVPNALFLTDSNADGVPDSWIKAGTGVFSIVSSPGAPVLGNALRIQDTLNSFTQVVVNTAAGVWAAGDRIAFCGRFKSATSSGSASIAFTMTGGTPASSNRGVNSYGVDSNGWKTFYMETCVPPGSTSGQVSLFGQGLAVDMQVAQLGLYNLTQLGVL